LAAPNRDLVVSQEYAHDRITMPTSAADDMNACAVTGEGRSLRFLRSTRDVTLTSSVAILLLLSCRVYANADVANDCGPEASPIAFGAIGEAPKVETWSGPASNAAQRAAESLSGAAVVPGLLISLAGSFRSLEDADGLLSRFGAVANLLTVRYWSVTDRKWRPLVVFAAALTAPTTRRIRDGFSAAELRTGQDAYLAQQDSRSASEAVYRMRVRDSSHDRFTLETENVTAVRWWGITLFAPRAIRSTYLLQQRCAGVWSYYSVTNIAGSGWLISGHEKSYVNRVVALYRHLAGIPTDLEPPAAP
jgi:hypothetical protein